MRKYLKKHWFGFLIFIIVFIYVSMILLVVSAPRQDLHDRGFIKCTKAMMSELASCPQESRTGCIFKGVIENNICDFQIIFDGVGKWINGEQPRPWSNYLFEPDLPLIAQETQRQEDLEEFYRQNPDIKNQMELLNQERLKLEEKWKEKTDEQPISEK